MYLYPGRNWMIEFGTLNYIYWRRKSNHWFIHQPSSLHLIHIILNVTFLGIFVTFLYVKLQLFMPLFYYKQFFFLLSLANFVKDLKIKICRRIFSDFLKIYGPEGIVLYKNNPVFSKIVMHRDYEIKIFNLTVHCV